MLLKEEGKCSLSCITCSNQITSGRSFRDGVVDDTPGSNKPVVIKSLTAQIREMAVRASGAYKNCKPCVCLSGSKAGYEDEYPDRIQCSYRRTGGDVCSLSKMWGKELRVRLEGNSSGEITPATASSCRSESMICEGHNGSNEWVAHVEPGVLISFVSLLEGGNELKKIRFSRDMFNKWQAQRWWSENYEKVIELYNIQKLNRQTIPLQTPKQSEDEVSGVPSMKDGPRTPPLSKEQLLSSTHHSKGGEDFSSDLLDHRSMQSCQHNNDNDLVSTSTLSDINGTRIERSLDKSARSSSSYETDHSGQLSVSNASDLETEWVEQDEPGIYITIRELPGGARELRRVRFSREKYGEMHARLWWEENRARIQEQYL